MFFLLLFVVRHKSFLFRRAGASSLSRPPQQRSFFHSTRCKHNFHRLPHKKTQHSHRARTPIHTQGDARERCLPVACLPCQLSGPSALSISAGQPGRQSDTMRGAQREKINASSLYPCGRDKERPVRDALLLAQIRDVPANTGQLATLLYIQGPAPVHLYFTATLHKIYFC